MKPDFFWPPKFGTPYLECFMKALRITCFICAAYYALHAGFMLINDYLGAMAAGILPAEELAQNPALNMQVINGQIARHYAPYLFIGMAACLALALFTRQLWKAIPFIAVLLFAGGIAWAAAHAIELRPYYAALSGMVEQMPGMGGMLGNYVKNSMSNGQYAGSIPLLLPGFVIFIFWRKASKEMEQAPIAVNY